MDIFSKNKFLLRLVFSLVFLNLLSIGYLWWPKKGGPANRPPRPEKENVSSVLKDKLQLTDEQEKEFRGIREDFARKEEILGNLIKEQRDSLNMELFNENTDTLQLKTLARHIAENEYCMEVFRIEQAQKLKSICSKEQLEKFQILVKEIRDYFQPQKKSDNKPPVNPKSGF
jgi:hypothetical protein